MLLGENLQNLFLFSQNISQLCIISVFTFDPFLFFFQSNIDPSQFIPSEPVSNIMIETALSEWWCSVKLNCVYCLMKPPPRRPAVFAEQNESEEERQFRKVFQQLAGGVSAVLPSANSFSQFCMFSCFSCNISAVTFWNPFHLGHGSEPSWADEHPQQNHFKT